MRIFRAIEHAYARPPLEWTVRAVDAVAAWCKRRPWTWVVLGCGAAGEWVLLALR